MFELLKTRPYDDYFLRNEVLYKNSMGFELLVVPNGLEAEVFKLIHSNGHWGVKKVEEIIKQQYFIKSLKEKIAKCIKNCIPCILAERKHGKQEELLHTVEKGDRPLETFHMDHQGPMTTTCKQ